ncbi:unnamed protein product, partial [Mesorhabditis belari]|uniref:C6 domain-containing protein n=1 Tax=Mesorhabditis belari TaxID=2138241 RepID=A0AAF3FJ54_9BILA
MILLYFVSSLIGIVTACAPTSPTNGPSSTCCPIDVFNEAASTGRALFNPQLSQCPDTANFICSVRDDGVTDPTIIQINGATTIATGPNGINTMVGLQCMRSSRIWQYTDMQGTVTTVTSITCLNNAAG